MIVETPKAKIKSEGQAVAGKTKESKAKCGQLFSWLLMHSRKTFFRGRDGGGGGVQRLQPKMF